MAEDNVLGMMHQTVMDVIIKFAFGSSMRTRMRGEWRSTGAISIEIVKPHMID